jgi:hypothetical protein
VKAGVTDKNHWNLQQCLPTGGMRPLDGTWHSAGRDIENNNYFNHTKFWNTDSYSLSTSFPVMHHYNTRERQ